MKISELWLREWVNPSLSMEQLASQLTMAGLEVDSLAPVAGDFKGVIVAEVLHTKPHPQADKLTLCEVKTAENTVVNVVCGASNVRPGLKVALATVGAQLGALKIKEAKLRGEPSNGMLCSASELGMVDQSEGIMELDESAPIGQDFRQYLQLDDSVLEVDLTPNRADCFSVLGVAREVAALNLLALQKTVESNIAPQIDDRLTVNLRASEACPRYCGRVLRGINSKAETPVWMKEKLRRSGIRSLHPVVDVTNYVMMELGQPMHAFDLNTINGEITVRFANENEPLNLLDGQEIVLNKDVLVISDEQQALAMAGVMGGASSAVQEATQDIFLEAAFFSPQAITGVARRFGLCTDSSQRFERGVDSQLQLAAIERATELLQGIVGGQAGPVVSVLDEKTLPQNAPIPFDIKKVKKLTGVDLPIENITSILKALGMQVEQRSPELFNVTAPSHRFDIRIEEDLVEEIVRLNGYDKLQAEPGLTVMRGGESSPTEIMSERLGTWLASRAYRETISYSFVDPDLQETLYPESKTMTLLNPLSSELSQMRVGLWPGLLASMVHNAHRQQHAMKLFEIGVAFQKDHDKLHEEPMVAGLMMGEMGDLNWSEVTRPYDFFDMKGDLQALFVHLGLKQVEFIAARHASLHPRQSAKIRINGEDAGWMGVLHPRLTEALDISQSVILFELSFSALKAASTQRYRPISKYPQIRRDLSFLVADEVSASDIEKAIRGVPDAGWLKAVDIFDVYKGQGIPEGKKSLAISLTLQDSNRTLIDSEINELISAILKKLENGFAIILRD